MSGCINPDISRGLPRWGGDAAHHERAATHGAGAGTWVKEQCSIRHLVSAGPKRVWLCGRNPGGWKEMFRVTDLYISCYRGMARAERPGVRAQKSLQCNPFSITRQEGQICDPKAQGVVSRIGPSSRSRPGRCRGGGVSSGSVLECYLRRRRLRTAMPPRTSRLIVAGSGVITNARSNFSPVDGSYSGSHSSTLPAALKSPQTAASSK